MYVSVTTDHRDSIDAEEQWVANLLNGERTPKRVKRKGNENAVRSLVESIRSDFSKHSHAEHRGSEYDDLGDLKLIRDDDSEIYLELKNVEEGIGTLANTGGVLVAGFDLIEDALEWDEFRRERGFESWRDERLNEFDYPNLEDIKGRNQTEKRARFLRDEVLDYTGGPTIHTATSVLDDPEISHRERKAAEIIETIYRHANEEKHEYISHLSERDQNEENIRKLAVLLLCGVHTQELLQKYWDQSVAELESTLDEYRIYIYNQKEDNVFKKTPLRYIESLSQRGFDIELSPDNTSIKIRIEEDGEYVPFLRISINWANVFQGIGTPSANTFLTGPAKSPDWEP